MLTEVVAESKRILGRGAGGRKERLTDQIRKSEEIDSRPPQSHKQKKRDRERTL
jgi:hypothetical protein